jgi:hypothetical protein
MDGALNRKCVVLTLFPTSQFCGFLPKIFMLHLSVVIGLYVLEKSFLLLVTLSD